MARPDDSLVGVWLTVQKPKETIPLPAELMGLDQGEIDVILLAKEIEADWVLIDEEVKMVQRKQELSPTQDDSPDRRAVEERYRSVVQALEHRFGECLVTVVLFGSQARGAARPDSDHDLFVVIEDLPQDPLARSRTVRTALMPILDRLPGPTGFVAKTPVEVQAGLTPLLLDVCTEGVCLYGASYFEPLRQKALSALRQSGLHRRRMGGSLMWLFPRAPTGDWELSWEGYRESA
jgi:uncharacterized protein